MQKTIIASYLVEELERANHIYGTSFASPHEGYAIMHEELDELWEEIKKKHPDPERLREEAVQVGAMAIKFILSLEKWDGPEDMDTCDDCGSKVIMGQEDFFLESGTYGIPRGQHSKMVCGHCYETKYAGKG